MINRLKWSNMLNYTGSYYFQLFEMEHAHRGYHKESEQTFVLLSTIETSKSSRKRNCAILLYLYYRPILEYAAPVFHLSLPQYLADDLERVQQRSLGIIFKCEKYNKCLEYSGLETLVNRRQMLCSKLFDSITLNLDHKFYKLLPPKKKQTYNLRHKRSFSSLLARTKRFKNTFIPYMLNSK